MIDHGIDLAAGLVVGFDLPDGPVESSFADFD